jgi:hypothetical protein
MNKIIIVMALIFLAGCQLGFQRKENLQVPDVSIGVQGVELAISPGTQKEVFEGSSFSALFAYANLGTMDVEEGVYSVGYEKQYLSLLRPAGIGRFALRGKSTFRPEGEEKQLVFVFEARSLGPQVERYQTGISLNACYPYQTNAPLNVCIDTDLLGTRQVKACAPQPQAFPQGHGAPVVVAGIEPRMLPHEDPGLVRPEFVLTLQNKGAGQVVASQLYQSACSGRPLGAEGWNELSVSAILSDTAPLVCTPNPVRLKQSGDTRIVCTLPEGISTSQGTYTAPLLITLDYGYFTSTTLPITIVRTTT